MIFEKLTNRIDCYEKDIINIQSKLVAIQAISPENGGAGEYEKSQYIKKLFEEIECDEIKEYNAFDDRVPSKVRPNILATFKGKSKGKSIWVLSHSDVVPAGDLSLWQSDPFSLRVDGDKIFGRGVEDNHQGFLCGYLAVKALKDENIKPAADINLLCVADEETGSKYGLSFLLQNYPDIFCKDDIFIVPDAGDVLGITIEVSEKSIMWIKFALFGKQCHASTPHQGINAFKVAAHLQVKFEQLYKLFPEKNLIFDPPASTFEATKKEQNVENINTIPGKDVFYMDCRILPDIDINIVETKIRQIVVDIENQYNVKIDMSFIQREQAAPPTPIESPVVQILQKAIFKVTGNEPKVVGIGGGTVAALFRKAGFQTAVWGTILDTCHQPNETALISNILSDAKVLAHVFTQNF